MSATSTTSSLVPTAFPEFALRINHVINDPYLDSCASHATVESVNAFVKTILMLTDADIPGWESEFQVDRGIALCALRATIRDFTLLKAESYLVLENLQSYLERIQDPELKEQFPQGERKKEFIDQVQTLLKENFSPLNKKRKKELEILEKLTDEFELIGSPAAMPTSTQQLASPPISPKELGEDSDDEFETVPTQAATIDEELKKKLFMDYISWLVLKKDPRKDLLTPSEEKMIQELEDFLIKDVPSFFKGSLPSEISALHKNLTTAILSHLLLFIKKYADVSKLVLSQRLTPKEEENFLFEKMALETSEEQLNEQLNEKICLCIRAFKGTNEGDFPLIKLLEIFVPWLEIPGLIEKSGPHFFCKVIDNLISNEALMAELQAGIDLSISVTTPPEDTVFSAEMGKIIEKICDALKVIGKASKTVKGAFWFFSSMTNKIGALFQESLHTALNQQSFLPFLSPLKLFLYNHEGDPILIDALTAPDSTSSQEECKAIIAKIKAVFDEKIKKESAAVRLLAWSSDADGFYKRLSEKLFLITQRPLILKLLLCTLLDGVIEGINKENTNASSTQ